MITERRSLPTRLAVFTRLMLLAAVCAALLTFAAGAPPAHAASCVVTTSAEAGAGSLREKLADANCTDIFFYSKMTIPLTSELAISHDVTINGMVPDGLVTISGGGTTRVFNNPIWSVTINRLTIANGNAGGGNGGGVYNGIGSLTVANSTFANNQAAAGGGIYSGGSTLNIVNSTFSGNSASGNGGGVYAFMANVVNSTFSGNSASGGGGFFSTAPSHVRNTIIAASPSGGNCGGETVLGSSSLADDASCAGFTQSSTIRLGPLGDYSGGFPNASMPAFPLLPASAALDAGDDTVCAAAAPGGAGGVDQRGVPRSSFGAHCDVGAFESHGFTLAISSGGNQSTPVNTAFANPLVVSVTANAPGEPVDGGQITFTPPGSGASAVISGSPATIASGSASVIAAANDTIGAYTVSASTAGAAPVGFTLTNLPCQSAVVVTSDANSGPGSLRQAIAYACPGGTITFDGDHTIALTSYLTIGKDLTIDGADYQITLNGGHTTEMFYIVGVQVTLNHLAILDGYAPDYDGGGIYNDAGSLTVSNSTISGNWTTYAGGGIANHGGTLTVQNSTLSGNSAMSGGGVFNYGGTVTVQNSTLSDNWAVEGGGVLNYHGGTLTVQNSTLSGNLADYGGGIFNFDGTLTVQNSTLSGNSAYGWDGDYDGGGAVNQYGDSAVSAFTNSTITGNDAPNVAGRDGVWLESGSLTLRNTIVAGNGEANCTVSGGSFDGAANDLANDATCPGFTQVSDVRLGALADYGDPTQTHALLPGSPAIDAGDNAACLATDQRGVARPVGAHCDIGAYESRGFTLAVSSGDGQSTPANTAFAAPLVVGVTPNQAGEPVDGGQVTFTSPGSGASAVLSGSPATITGGSASVTAVANDTGGAYTVSASAAGAASVGFTLTNQACAITVTSDADSGPGSLRQAIADVCPGGTITFDADRTITLATELAFCKNLTIDGAGRAVTLDGNHATRVFNITGGNVTLARLSIINGQASDCPLYASTCAGGLYVQNLASVVTLQTVTLAGCQANYGAGVMNNGTLHVQGSTFRDNTGGIAGGYGGALFNRNGATADVINSTFANNGGGSNGGGVRNEGALTLTNVTLSGNSATSGGGFSNTDTAVLQNTLLAANTGNNCDGYPFAGGSANNLSDDASCSGGFTQSSSLLLGALGNYGGDTATFPLLPGSAAIDAGASCSATDQRGLSRVGACDLGAFESQGFVLTKTGGDGQSAVVNTAFGNPLALSVTANNPVEPVDGGRVTFTAPGSGASAVIAGSPATIAGAGASVTAAANGTGGAYNVTASAAGAASVDLALTNLACAITVASDADSGAGTLRQAIADVCPGGTITFDGDHTITLASELVIGKSLTIEGAGHHATVSGGGTTRLFSVTGSPVTLNALTFTGGNASTSGGAIYNGGALHITNSTLATNTATYAGAGVYNAAGASLTLANSTVAHNSGGAEGGGVTNYGTLTAHNVTFAGNGGSVGGNLYNGGSLSFANTILANATAGGDCANAGTISANLDNLVQDGSCSTSSVNFKTGDPLLAALADNGGPTPTMALTAASPAIDAGDAAACAAAPVNGQDQRGQPRTDWQCDIGAFELRLSDSATVTKTIAGAGTYTFGPTMVKVVVNDAGCLSGLTIQRYDANHPAAPAPLQTGRWWQITPSPAGCTSGFDVNLTLPVTFTPDDADSLCRYASGAWNCRADSHTADTITRNGVGMFSAWTIGNNAPLAAPLSALDAAVSGNRVVITWETTSELGVQGYHIYRSNTTSGLWTRLDACLIPSQAPGSPSSYVYRFADATVQRGGSYRYRVTAIGLGGEELTLGTVDVSYPFGRSWLPLVR